MSNRLVAGLVIMGVALLALSLAIGPASGNRAAASSAPPTATVDLVAQGRALFSAKGCAVCHENALYSAPNLTTYDADPAFLRVWLRDPTAVRPETLMPNLQLDEAEIEALIAFLEVHSQR